MRLGLVEVVLQRYAAQQEVVVPTLARPKLRRLDAVQPLDRLFHTLHAEIRKGEDQTHAAQVGQHQHNRQQGHANGRTPAALGVQQHRVGDR